MFARWLQTVHLQLNLPCDIAINVKHEVFNFSYQIIFDSSKCTREQFGNDQNAPNVSDPPRVHLSLSTSLLSGQVAAVLTCDVDSSPPSLVKMLKVSFINSIGCKLFPELITKAIYFRRTDVHQFQNLV